MTPNLLFLLVFGAAGLAAIVGLFGDMLRIRRVGSVVPAALLIAGGAAAMAAGWTVEPSAAFGVFIVGGPFTSVPALVVLLAGVSLLAASPEASRPGGTAALVALCAGAAGMTATTLDLVIVLIALETSAVCAYALVAEARTARSNEAAMKYFVQGSVATGLFVFGMAVIVTLFAPDASVNTLVSALNSGVAPMPAVLGIVFIVAALAFKAGAAPFHSWAPDAYQTAPASSAGFLGGAVKLAMVSALSVLLLATLPVGMGGTPLLGVVGSRLLPLLAVIAALSILIGSLVALRQRSYTRMLGYAGVAQVGYAIIALVAVNPSAAIVFTITYAIAATGAFAAAGAFSRVRPEWDGGIEGLAGLGRRAPLLGAAVTVILVSLAGIPPLLGFWGKFQSFGAAISSAVQWGAFATNATGAAEATAVQTALMLGALAVIGIVGSVVSLGYYGSVLKALYFGESHEGESVERGGRSTAVVVAVALAVIVLGALPLLIGLSTSISGFLFRTQ